MGIYNYNKKINFKISFSKHGVGEKKKEKESFLVHGHPDNNKYSDIYFIIQKSKGEIVCSV